MVVVMVVVMVMTSVISIFRSPLQNVLEVHTLVVAVGVLEVVATVLPRMTTAMVVATIAIVEDLVLVVRHFLEDSVYDAPTLMVAVVIIFIENHSINLN